MKRRDAAGLEKVSQYGFLPLTRVGPGRRTRYHATGGDEREKRCSSSVVAGAGTGRDSEGIDTMKRVPAPSLLSTSMVPPWALTIQATKLRPNPRPFSRCWG